MRDKFRKLTCIVAAAAIAAAGMSLAGCSDSYSNRVPGDDIFIGDVASNGGFVVEKGNYVYFINGAEDYTASNKYGEVVKGALMRISKADLLAKNYEKTDTVVPMLFVAQDYDAGFYIYGDRVYFASPTTEKDQNGNVQNDWLSFKSAKLDGSDAMKDYYFRSDDNSVTYRYVEVDGVVYCLHADDSTLYSYNTQTGKDTVLVSGAGSSFYFDSSDPENATVYYTMSVTQDLDTENSSSVSYTQVYSVRADAEAADAGVKDGKASYTVKGGKTYSFDADYVQDEDKFEGFSAGDYTTYPYVNLGELVLDGRGYSKAYTDTRFTDDDASKAATPNGYTYTIQSYQNGGLYYTRAGVKDTSSDGESSALYYLADSVSGAEDWKTIQGQAVAGNVDTVALNTTNASSSALFSVEEKNGKRIHSYIYVSDSKIYKATAKENGTTDGDPLLLVASVSSATLWKTEGDYLYYYSAGSNGNNVTRINYKGEKDDYLAYPFGDSEEYKPAVVLEVDWNSSWYKPELIENCLFFSNAQSVGSTTYNYVYVVDLNGKDGIMNADELKAFNDKYEEVTDYIDDMDNDRVENALKYFFRTGDRAKGKDSYFEQAIADAIERGKSENYLYSVSDVEEVRAFCERRKSTNKSANDYSEMFKDENGAYYDVQSYFMNMVGALSEEDADAMEEAWKGTLEKAADEEEEGWATWQKVLLGVGIGAGVLIVAAAVAVVLVVRAKKKKKAAEEAEIVEAGRKKPVIDTTDDKSIDVYADDEPEAPAEEAAEEKIPEASEEEPAETEEKSEESGEEAEAPAEENFENGNKDQE